jgi:hypothetical protein
MGDKPAKPYVNPHPHRGHVDVVKTKGGHEHVTVKNRAAAEVIKQSYEQGIREKRK